MNGLAIFFAIGIVITLIFLAFFLHQDLAEKHSKQSHNS